MELFKKTRLGILIDLNAAIKALKEARNVARTSGNCTDQQIEKWNNIIKTAEG